MISVNVLMWSSLAHWGIGSDSMQFSVYCDTKKLELNPRGQVAPQVYVDNCDATN